MARGGRRNDRAIIVVRREEGGEHSHHGGAWKVAYADFVTAMMAFFLLMWLLNSTTEEQRRGLADYFNPTSPLSRSLSGSGQPFGGRTPHESSPMTSNAGAIRIEMGPLPVLQDIEEEDESDTPAQPVPWRDAPMGEHEEVPEAHYYLDLPPQFAEAGAEAEAPVVAAVATEAAQLPDAALRAELDRREREAMAEAAERLRTMVREDPALSGLAQQLLIEEVPEGLRIQLVDAERQPMFALGGSAPNERARALLARVAEAVARLPNAIAISGHTDSTPFRGGGERSNWDLSAERANATRRLLTEAGVDGGRIRSVTGVADREPMLPDQPEAAANRRVSITLLRQADGDPAPAPSTAGGAPAP